MTQDVEMLQRVRAVLKQHKLNAEVTQQVITAIYPDQNSVLLVGTSANRLTEISLKTWREAYDSPGCLLYRVGVEVEIDMRVCSFRAYSVNHLLADGLLVYPRYLERAKLLRDFQRLGFEGTLDFYPNVRFYSLQEIAALSTIVEPDQTFDQPFVGVATYTSLESGGKFTRFKIVKPPKPRKRATTKPRSSSPAK